MPRPPSDTVQIAIRIPRGWLARAAAIAPGLARTGVAVTRTDAIRAALARGLEEFEREAKDGEHGDEP